MPYPTEHAFRLAEPASFDRIRRENGAFKHQGKPIDVLWGVVGAGRGKATVQALRFPVSAWSPRDARSWLNAHGYDARYMEPAVQRANPSDSQAARIQAAADEYEAAHWGEPARKIVQVDHDRYLPDVVVGMGYLKALYVECEAPNGQSVAYEIHFARPSSLAYVTDGNTRLYAALSSKDKADVLKLIREHGLPVSPPMALARVASQVGGRQKSGGYPTATVRVLGTLTHVVYSTTKSGDGKSDYIHEFGEDAGGIAPALCVDDAGHLLLAGGSYNVEHRGIVN